MDEELKNKIVSAVATALLLGIAVCISLAFGYMPPDPPIPEEGVEVAMGYDEEGLGESASAEAIPSNSRPAASGNYATQQTEPSVSMPSDSKGTATAPEVQPNEKPKQNTPEINKNALFTGKKTTTSGGEGQGDTQGKGMKGDPNGTPGAKNYSGTPGGKGISYSLGDREARHLPKPSYKSDREGQIVVAIWVDQQGNVTRVDAPAQGSTIADPALVEQSKQAARQAKFDPSSSAVASQKGTITYVFRKQ